jgi:hypothetical protein
MSRTGENERCLSARGRYCAWVPLSSGKKRLRILACKRPTLRRESFEGVASPSTQSVYGTTGEQPPFKTAARVFGTHQEASRVYYGCSDSSPCWWFRRSNSCRCMVPVLVVRCRYLLRGCETCEPVRQAASCTVAQSYRKRVHALPKQSPGEAT